MIRITPAAKALLLPLLLVLLPPGASAGGQGQPAAQAPKPPAPPAGPPPSCSGPEYRQFDFWIGDWNVTSGGGQAGTNNVTLDVAGCVVHEHWVGTKGGSGESFNFYDRQDGRWHQLWVGSGGGVVRLAGEYKDRKMQLAGEAPGPDGKPRKSRMTFHNNEDGTVRQVWETSPDEGRTWQVLFEGLYAKK